LCNSITKIHVRQPEGTLQRGHAEVCERLAEVLGGEYNVRIVDESLYRRVRSGELLPGKTVAEFDVLVDDRVVLEYETGLARRYEKAIKLGIEKFFFVDIINSSEVIVFRPVVVGLSGLKELVRGGE